MHEVVFNSLFQHTVAFPEIKFVFEYFTGIQYFRDTFTFSHYDLI
jgi:hypothetical protein